MKKNILVMMTLGLIGCITKVNYTQRTYASVNEKADEPYTIEYKVPSITPTSTTKNSQEKGGVLISVEILPFSVERTIKTERVAVIQDPNKPSFDRFEIKQTPQYNVDEKCVQFKIRVRNNEQVPLRLSSIGFALVIDETQWSFPDEQIDEWNKGLILSGFEKQFTINGPNMRGLENAKVVYILLNGVPTNYDSAGNITKKSNFEWYYECSTASIVKEEIITYSYESSAIRKEKCTSCDGSGKNPKQEVCSKCTGNGKYIGFGGGTVTCNQCSGTGKVYPTCKPCFGNGSIAYPESTKPTVQESVNWYGWHVKIVSIPMGAQVSGCDPENGTIATSAHTAPYVGAWYRTKNNPCPIILEYEGKQVKVMPVKPDGRPSNKIIVDFTGEIPKVVCGQDVTYQ